MVARRGICLPFLPEEIIEQVILRVQCMKSVVRCMSVCRSWYALIKSRHFINTHLSHPSNIKYLFCHRGKAPRRGDKGCHYCWLHYDNEAFHEYSLLDHPDKASSSDVHGCNGLICYKKANSERLCLWNPAIRKLKVLPASPQDHDDRSHHHICVRPFKLWFDSKTNDYRILRIIVYIYKATLVEFYSLNTNSWTLISDNASIASRGIGRCTYVNGIWYWMDHANYGVNTLMYLDTENWALREVKTWTTALTTPMYLTPIDDRYLVIFGYVDPNLFHQWRWSLLEVYDQSSNQFYIIVDFRRMSYPIDGWVPIGVRNNCEILLQNYMKPNLEIVSWNLKTRLINRFVPAFSHRLEKVFPYTERLVLLNDVDAITISPGCREAQY